VRRGGGGGGGGGLRQNYHKIMAASASASSTPVSAAAMAVKMEDLDGPEAKQSLGGRFYALIEVEQGSLAGKITGMLLHGLDNSELVVLIDDQATLKIQEALAVLEAYHQTKVAPMVPAAVARTVSVRRFRAASWSSRSYRPRPCAAPRHHQTCRPPRLPRHHQTFRLRRS
jgi:hypothetical protein